MHNDESRRKRLHQNWRTWLVVGLMLMAIGMYVFTLDDSIVPVSPSGSNAQAPTAPPKP